MPFLKRLLEHPFVDIAVALILIGTSLSEGWGTLRQDVMNLDPGVHHGVLLYGLVNLLRTVPNLLDAVERTVEVSTGGA